MTCLKMRDRWIWIIGIVLLSQNFAELWADPTHAKPTENLNSHGTAPESKEVYGSLLKTRQTLEKLLETLQAKGQTYTGNGDDCGQGHALLNKIDREITRLRVFGEPFAADTALYSGHARNVVNFYLGTFLMTPQGTKKTQQARDFLAKQAPQRQKVVAQLTQMVRNNQFEAAEKKLDATLYDLDTVLAFLSAFERGEIYKPFEPVSSAISQAMSQARAKQAMAARDRLTQQVLAERDTLLKKIQAGAMQLPQRGTIEVDGKQLEGPQAIAEFGKSWGAVHVGLMKCAAIFYGTKGSSYGDGGYSGSDDSSEYNRWSTENQKLTEGVRQGFMAIIAAEANAAPTPMARKRYVEYLQALSTLAGRVDNSDWLGSLEPSLEQLANKGQLKTAVEAYKAATHDLLRWRARIATAQHQAASKDYPAISHEAPKRLTVGEGKPEGFYSQQFSLPHMVTYVAKSMPKSAEQMLKLKVQAPKVARMDGKDGVVFSRFDQGIFLRLPAQMRAEKGIAELASDLLISPEHPPLTLEAAVAIGSAQRGEFESVGGEIVGMDVGGVITRFATLPPIAGSFVSCDRIQPSWAKVGELPGLCLQFSVMPQWVTHKYFFAKAIVPSPPEANPAPAPAANPAPDASPKKEG